MKSDADNVIVVKFLSMSQEELINTIATTGGVVSHTGFIDASPGYIAAERDDGWCLEVRNAGHNYANDLWIKARTKMNSSLEKEAVIKWLQSLGFRELEADIYYASNVPHKRHIAAEVGTALREIDRDGRVNSPIGRTTSKAVDELRADVSRMIVLVNNHIYRARSGKGVMALAAQ